MPLTGYNLYEKYKRNTRNWDQYRYAGEIVTKYFQRRSIKKKLIERCREKELFRTHVIYMQNKKYQTLPSNVLPSK